MMGIKALIAIGAIGTIIYKAATYMLDK